MVLEIGGDVRAPIIYADSAKICFTIKDRKEKFTFKNHIHHSPGHPQTSYLPKETTMSKKRNNQRRKNKARQPREESVKMINTPRSEYNHLLASPFLTKKKDPGVPMIECTIKQRIFHNTFCNIGSVST
jgi:hypothetical protein